MSFIDEMGLGAAPAMATRGWSNLGSAIGNAGTGGGLRGEMAYEMGLQRGASAASALEEARLRRDKGLALSQLTPEMFTDPTLRGQLALLAARGQVNLNEVGGGLGHLQEVDQKGELWRAMQQGAGIPQVNTGLAIIGGKPVETTKVSDNTLINPYATPDQQAAYGGNVPTELGMADIALRGAQAGAANASARERDAQAARATAGIGADKAANYDIVQNDAGQLVRVSKLPGGATSLVLDGDGQPVAGSVKGGSGAAGKVSLPSPEVLKQTFGENKIGGEPNDQVTSFITWQAQKASTDPAYNNGNYALRQYLLTKSGTSQAGDQTASMADALGLGNTGRNSAIKAGKVTFANDSGGSGSVPSDADPAHLDPGSSAGAASKGGNFSSRILTTPAAKVPKNAAGVATPSNQDEYDALDPGTQYLDPNGVLRVKGQG